MKVVASKDMPYFNFTKGQELTVTKGQYAKMQEKYQCFEEPDRMVSVRVITKMHRDPGWQGWFPGTLQGGMMSEMKPYIEKGYCKLEVETPKIDGISDPKHHWTFTEDFGEYKQGQVIEATTLEMQIGSKIYHAVCWKGLVS